VSARPAANPPDGGLIPLPRIEIKPSLERDDVLLIVVPLDPFDLSMIFSENRCPLFRIML